MFDAQTVDPSAYSRVERAHGVFYRRFALPESANPDGISATGRNQLGLNNYEDFIQTDAAINPGSSGGPLVDTAGNLIGINSIIFSQSGGSMGIGFAIPVSLARTVLEQIIKDGAVTRGWLGLEPQDMTAEAARALDLALAVEQAVEG